MEIFKNIATVVGCISACIALAITIFKPLRQKIIKTFTNENAIEHFSEDIKIIKQQQEQSLINDQKIEKRIDDIEQRVHENEADRIRTELFDCGNRCRRGIRLHPEEMDHIRTVFHKYNIVLHQNHEGESEYNFIIDYYNHQDFPKYHKLNTTK